MAPILGIYASSQQASKLGNYYSIATTTVGAGGASSVTFSSIPSTYTHLQIRFFGRSTVTATTSNINLVLNSDTGTNYRRHYLYGNGSASGAGADTAAQNAFSYMAQISGSTATANLFGTGFIDILDYTNTNKNKVYRSLNGMDANGSGNVTFESGVWLSTTAINSLTFTSSQSGNFAQYSSFALYGVK